MYVQQSAPAESAALAGRTRKAGLRSAGSKPSRVSASLHLWIEHRPITSCCNTSYLAGTRAQSACASHDISICCCTKYSSLCVCLTLTCCYCRRSGTNANGAVSRRYCARGELQTNLLQPASLMQRAACRNPTAVTVSKSVVWLSTGCRRKKGRSL